jgi:hypothetical protein
LSQGCQRVRNPASASRHQGRAAAAGAKVDALRGATARPRGFHKVPRFRTVVFVQHQHRPDVRMLDQTLEHRSDMRIDACSGESDGLGSGVPVRPHDVTCKRARTFPQGDQEHAVANALASIAALVPEHGP